MTEYRITALEEHTWQIDEEGVRFFLLEGTEKALLIDSGMIIHNAKEIAETLTDLPIRLLNTHADRDHTGSNHEFEWFYMHPSEASNFYHTQHSVGTIEPIWDGTVLDLGNRRLEIIALPGHTPGSIAVLDIDRRMLFSGDPVQDGDIFMFGIQREVHAYQHSLARLGSMKHRFDRIYPSHGTCPVSPDLIDRLYTGMDQILAGRLQPEKVQLFDERILKYNLGFASFLLDDPDAVKSERPG